MCQAKIKRYELIELSVKSGALGRVNFPSVPQLRNQANQIVVITGIDVFTTKDVANSILDMNIPGLAPGDVSTLALTLNVNGEEQIYNMPLTRLINTSGDPTTDVFSESQVNFDNLTNVDFDKSYVTITSAAGGDYVIPFGISYQRLERMPAGGFA